MLDDYHLIRDPAIHDGVRFLLDHLPRASHLVIATRTEPPVGVSRLRARASWASSPASSCASTTPRRPRCSTTRCRSRWPPRSSTRLQRAHRGLGRRALPRRPLAARPARRRRGAEDLGYDRHLVDYLGDEVLSAQDAAGARASCVDTCVLDRFCAPLCDAVRGRRQLEAAARRDRAREPLPRPARRARASGSATTTSSATSCAASSRRRARPSTSPSCTRAPARGRADDGRRFGGGRPPARRGAARRRPPTSIADVVERLAAERARRDGHPLARRAAARRRHERSAAVSGTRLAGPRLRRAGRRRALGRRHRGRRRRARRCPTAAPPSPPASPCCARRWPTAAGDLGAAEALGAQAVELESAARLALAGRRAGHARRGASLPRRAARGGRRAARAGGRDARARAPTAWPCCGHRARSPR